MFNATENLNETELKMWTDFIEKVVTEESDVVHTLLMVSMYIIFFASIIGNSITCIVIHYDKSMHTATNFYLFNLAISDIIVSFAIILEVNEHYLRSQKFPYYLRRLVCKIHFFVVVALWNNGILIMTALAIERYVAICYPLMLKTKSVWRRVTKIIVLIWVVVILETVPELWTSELMITPKFSICFAIPTPFARVVNGVMALVTFVIPLSIMTFVYTMIACEVRASQRRRPHDMVFNQRYNRTRVHKLIVALTLSFLISWLPFFAMRMMIFMYDITEIVNLNLLWRIGYNLSVFNSWFSTVLNPLLFSLMSTKFRKALRSFWKKKIKREPEVTRTSKV